MSRMFCSQYSGDVDLDDPCTYKHLPDTHKALETLFYKEVGYAHLYMYFIYKEAFNADPQRKRVDALITKFVEGRKMFRTHKEGLLWLKEQVFIFQDCIENMC